MDPAALDQEAARNESAATTCNAGGNAGDPERLLGPSRAASRQGKIR